MSIKSKYGTGTKKNSNPSQTSPHGKIDKPKARAQKIAAFSDKDMTLYLKPAEEHIQALEAMQFRAKLELPNGDHFYLVPQYVKDGTKQLSIRDAALMCAATAAFPGAVISEFKMQTQGETTNELTETQKSTAKPITNKTKLANDVANEPDPFETGDEIVAEVINKDTKKYTPLTQEELEQGTFGSPDCVMCEGTGLFDNQICTVCQDEIPF